MQWEFNPFNAAFSLHYCKFGLQNCKGRCNLAFTFVCCAAEQASGRGSECAVYMCGKGCSKMEREKKNKCKKRCLCLGA